MKEYFTERRVTNQVCDYWNKLKGGKGKLKYPRKSDIDPEDIINIFAHCVIIDRIIENGIVKYEFFHLGEKIKQFHKEDLFRETFIPFISPNIETFKEYLDEVCETGEPIIEESEATNINQEEVKFRQCLLPLSSDDNEIAGVLGALSCKLYK